MTMNCTDCGCALSVHEAGWCYGVCTISHQCRHEPQVFKIVDDTPRKPRVVVAYGTRPERIKLESVARELRALGVEVVEWCSGQHDAVRGENGQIGGSWGGGLTWGIASTMDGFENALRIHEPAAVVVQGDTATAFACAQAAFLARVPVAHVEAGLRTYADEPWPEEAFRRQIAAVARWHFAPDVIAAQNVANEIDGHDPDGSSWTPKGLAQLGIHVTGNTVIDTLPREPFRVLVTLHRRENWGRRIESALSVLAAFGDHRVNENVCVRVIRHPNWQAQNLVLPAVYSDGFDYKEPVNREKMLEWLQYADLVVTDSGGLQEEAAHFGVPCIVLRTATERTALQRLGAVEIVDPDATSALRAALERELAKRRAYGDGSAGRQIAEILTRELSREP